MKLLSVTALFLLLLTTGVFWGTWFPLTRSLDAFTPDEFIHIGKVIIGNAALPMRFLLPATLLLMFITTGFFHRNKSKLYIYGVISFVLIISVLLITLLILVPIDNQIKTWTTETIPSNFPGIREKWALWHSVRTFISLLGFLFFGWMLVGR